MDATTQSAPYPADRETDVVLHDGSTVHVRPVREDDRGAIDRFLHGISLKAIELRFFGLPDLQWVTDWSVNVNYVDRYALVAESGTPRTIIAHAAYVGVESDRAEVAFLVADGWYGRGIATILMAHLAEFAHARGFTTFVAQVMAANHPMIEVFRDSGFEVEVRCTRDAIEVEFPTSMDPHALERFQERDRIAAVAAVRNVLAPRSVAVIGASRRRGTVGGELLHNVVSAGFTGTAYAVNEHGGRLDSLDAYRSVTELPEPVDLAVVAVPAGRVLDVVRGCAAAGVRAVVVISAGFAELGGEGRHRQAELVAICRDAGMRLVGPNCLGVLNTSRDVQLDATFAPHQAAAGDVAFLSQSGALGVAIIEAAARLGLGLSSFVSVGNKADLSGNDFLQYWEQDRGTDVALLYLESLGNPRKFARVARRFARRKPLVAVKSGRSPAGARATASHTGALLSASDVTVGALFNQAGVIRTDTLAEMFNVAALLAEQPVPAGDRVAIVTNAGGPGIVCADACTAAGVQVPEPSVELAAKLAADLPNTASTANPIDMIATASAEDYRKTLATVVGSGEFDAILVIFVPPLVTDAIDVATAINEVAATTGGCPIAAVFMTAEGPPRELAADKTTVPGYQFPEEAAQAIALSARYGRWRSRPEGVTLSPDLRSVAHGAAIVSRELAGGGWMSQRAVVELLECYGIPQVPARFVADGHGAVDAAGELGMPVALKGVAAGLLHKRDVGAVALALATREDVRRAAEEIRDAVSNVGYELEGLQVQAMIEGGVELLVGVVQDENFGPVLACGAGGTNVELVKDVAVRITPVTDLDAAEMLRALKLFPLLTGFRGSRPCDVAAVEDVILRVSVMVEAHPEIVELDCNPLIACPDGAAVVDARVRVHDASPTPPVPSAGR